jgi:fructose 1,6-bisphosphatase
MMEVHQVQIKLQQRQSLMEIIMDQGVINLTTKRQHGQLLTRLGQKHKQMIRRDWRIKKRQDGKHLISSKQLSKLQKRLGKMLTGD